MVCRCIAGRSVHDIGFSLLVSERDGYQSSEKSGSPKIESSLVSRTWDNVGAQIDTNNEDSRKRDRNLDSNEGEESIKLFVCGIVARGGERFV